MTRYPTSHEKECDGRKPDMELQQFYLQLLKALALEDQSEFERLTSSYLVGNFGAYLKEGRRNESTG